jgi:hypothetical protein
MANPDFFLNFGSNAKTWASGLSGELKPAISSINELTTALERYDAATDNRKTNGPLDSLFTRLDQVSQKFSDLTGSLASTFDKAIEGIGLLKDDMANLLASVKGVNASAAAAKRGPGRPALAAVDQNDAQSAAQLRNAQTLRANVNSANEKMKRLAELNGTLATRMSEAGDKTVILSRSVGGLVGASHNAIRGLDSLEARLSRFGEGVVINAPAGGTPAGGGGMAMAEMPAIMASFVEALRGVTLTVGEANIQAARAVSQVETAAKATTAEALETQRFTTNERSAMQGPQVNTRLVEGSKKPLPVLEGAAWDRPAEAGSYAVGTRKVTFRRADLIPGETFNEQFARTEALDKRFRQVQRTLPTAETIDPQNGRLLQKISDAFFKGGGVHQDYMERIGDRKGLSASASLQESITANPGGHRFLAGAQDEKMLEQARAAGLGTTMQQVVTKALEFTTKRRVGVDTIDGTLPMARARQLEEFIAQELKANPHQTFGAMGDAELSRVRKRMDEDILRAGGYTEERGTHPVTGEPLEGVYHPPQGQLPMLLQDHPDVQALYQGALRRQVKDTEGREYSSGLSAQSQGRREMSQRQELFIDKGRENDTSVSRDRLAQNYALPTQLNRYQEHLAAAQREHEKALAAHVDIMEDVSTGNVFSKQNPDGVTPEQIEAAKVRRDSTAASVQNWQAEVNALREKITEQKKSTAASVEGSKDAAKRYDEISTNARAARALVRRLPQDLVEQEERPAEEPVLPDRKRAAELRRRRADAQRLLESLNRDPEGFAQRSQATLESEQERERTRALTAQRAKQAEIQKRIDTATTEIAPGVAAEKRLRDAALDARQKWEQRQLDKGVPVAELDAGRRRRTEERAARGGFSSEDLAAEKKYVQAKQARIAEEERQQTELAALQDKARAARRRANEKLLKQGVSREDIDAQTAARNAERLANGGFSKGDLPAEQKAIAARLATPQGRLDQALREQVAGVPLDIRPVTRPAEAQFSNVSIGRARQRLKDVIEGYTHELEGTGRREFGAAETAESRAERIRPQLTAFGIPAAKAATLAFGTNAQIEKALLAAAEKMDAAAVKQQQAADKAEAKQDREDGFTTTPAVKRQRKGKKAKKFGQVVGADGEEVEVEEDAEEAAPTGKKKKRSGAEANLSGEASAAERTAATKILNDRKAVLQVEHDEILARRQAAEQGKRDLGGNRQANRRNLSEEQNAALSGFVAESAAAKEELTRVNQEMHALNTEVLRLRGKVKQAADATTPATATGGGAGAGGRPPRRPTATGGGGDEPPERPGRTPANDPYLQEILNRRLATFSPETQAAIAQARQQAAITAETKRLSDEQKSHVLDAAQQFRSDPAFRDVDRETARRTFATGLGLPRSAQNNRFLVDTFKPGGLLSADPSRDAAGAGTASQVSAEKMARLNGILAQSSGKVREALLAEFVAQERLARVEMMAGDNAERLAAAKRSLSVASRNVSVATEQEAAGEAMPGGLSGLLAHGGRQAVRFMSFQIAFTGLEKVRELVDTGIQAQTQFIRLEANLNATGRSAEGVMDKLGKISSETAQPLAHTIQAASELTGVLKGEDELMEGSKIASELANISHGHLTATQAAIGLRDVTDAYGLSGVKALRGVGDMIARISQVTGVSVHDVIEGTTQLAQEARSFGLSQRQAAVLAAEVTKNTGESGEAAAEQVSRVLSTMNNTKVQQQLENTIVPALSMEGTPNKDAGKAVATQELFAEHGGAGKALTNLLQMYDQLSERQRQSIDALVGAGRQARALTGMLRDAATTADLIKKVADDEGALATQSERFLHTVGGALQKLGADFRRLGADMLEAHLFDILMIIVTGLDHLMTTADSVIRNMNNLFNSNPITKNLMRMAILLGEVSLAFKVFGSAGSLAMTKLGMGGFVNRFAAGRATQAAAQAEATAATPLMFGRTRVMWGMGKEAASGLFAPTSTQILGSAATNPTGNMTAAQADAMTAAERRSLAATAGATAGRAAPIMILPASQRFIPGLDTATGRTAVPPTPVIPASQRFIPGLDTATGTATAVETEAARVRVGAAAAAANLGSLGASMGRLALSVAGPMLALAGLIALIDQFSKAGHEAGETKKHTTSLLDDITGKSAEERKKDAEKTHTDEVRDAETEAAKRREGDFKHRPGVGGFIKDVFDVPLEVRRTRDLFTGDTSGGRTSNKFETDNANNVLKYGKMLDDAEATGDPKKIAAAQKAIDKALGDGAEKLINSAGDRNARDRATSLLWEVKQRLDEDAAQRIENMMGIKDLDILSLQQLENIQTFNTKLSSIDVRTSREDPQALQDAFVDTGVNPRSQIGRLAQHALVDDTLERAQDTSALDRLELKQLDVEISAKPIGDVDRDRLIKARDATFSNLQAQLNLIDQLTVGNPDQMSQLLAKMGNLGGATGQLLQETEAIKGVIGSLDPQDPRYLQNLNLLADKNQQAADMAIQGQVQDLTLNSARNPNAVSQARNAAKAADLKLSAARDASNATRADFQAAALKAAEDKLAAAKQRQKDFVPTENALHSRPNIIGPYVDEPSMATLGDLETDVKAAEDGVVAAKALVSATATDRAAAVSAAMAAKAQADQAVRQAMQDELTSANNLKVVMLQASGAGTLAMDAQRVKNANEEVTYATNTFGAGSAQESNAKSSALQAVIQQKQDTHDQATSATSLRAAIQANAGDTVGAARSNLAKANSDLRFAVETYGKDSKQANDARAAAISANATLQKDIDDALNASLDLEISMLSNRGNDSDKRRILDDKVTEAQNHLNAFTARGGKLNTPEGKRLQAGVNDARRSRIDEGVQIEVDTLEFQRATFAISASQEIAALQNILKTKKLTQDRARAIMLQIKGLQDQNAGQFNLGDIKLPTVYDVRRTMQAGQAGAAAAASTIGYQDNKTVNITINGGDMPSVQAALSANLGSGATGRVTVATKKGT